MDIGPDELLAGEGMQVLGPAQHAATVGEDDAEFGQFEDGDVDPAAVEQRGCTEERMR